MDDAYRDAANAKLKDQEARRIRNEEALHGDNPRVVKDLEDAARRVDAEAEDFRRQAAEDFAAERAPAEDTE
jgi:hypothetical protein